MGTKTINERGKENWSRNCYTCVREAQRRKVKEPLYTRVCLFQTICVLSTILYFLIHGRFEDFSTFSYWFTLLEEQLRRRRPARSLCSKLGIMSHVFGSRTTICQYKGVDRSPEYKFRPWRIDVDICRDADRNVRKNGDTAGNDGDLADGMFYWYVCEWISGTPLLHWHFHLTRHVLAHYQKWPNVLYKHKTRNARLVILNTPNPLEMLHLLSLSLARPTHTDTQLHRFHTQRQRSSPPSWDNARQIDDSIGDEFLERERKRERLPLYRCVSFLPFIALEFPSPFSTTILLNPRDWINLYQIWKFTIVRPTCPRNSQSPPTISFQACYRSTRRDHPRTHRTVLILDGIFRSLLKLFFQYSFFFFYGIWNKNLWYAWKHIGRV